MACPRLVLVGDDECAVWRESHEDTDASESADSAQHLESFPADDRALLVCLPAQLQLDASAMQDMRDMLFADSKELAREPRVCLIAGPQ